MKKMILFFLLFFLSKSPMAVASFGISAGAITTTTLGLVGVYDNQQVSEVSAIVGFVSFIVGGILMGISGSEISGTENILLILDENSTIQKTEAISSALAVMYPEIEDRSVYDGLAIELNARYQVASAHFDSMLKIGIRDVTVPKEKLEVILAPANLTDTSYQRIVLNFSN